jgi:hypothetical protein
MSAPAERRGLQVLMPTTDAISSGMTATVAHPIAHPRNQPFVPPAIAAPRAEVPTLSRDPSRRFH